MNRRDEQVGKSLVVREFLKAFNRHPLLLNRLEISCQDPIKKKKRKKEKKNPRDLDSEALI